MSNDTKRDDGGPAFPELRGLHGNHIDIPRYVADSAGGMKLRDWFAGQALIGLFAIEANPDHGPRLSMEELAGDARIFKPTP